MKLLLLPIFFLAAMSNVYSQRDTRSEKQTKDSLFTEYIYSNRARTYQSACNDARNPTMFKIDSNLTAIKQEDSILVVAWKSDWVIARYHNDKQGYYNTREFEIWVVEKKELDHKLKECFASSMDTNLRMQQLLGLPPVKGEKRGFVEFYVKKSDLFRPCPDSEINDNTCGLCFSDAKNLDHLYWMISNRQDRYYNFDPIKNSPWTQLGYTYDWNQDTKWPNIGVSEFVIRAYSQIKVKKTYSTQEYFIQIQ